MLIDRQPALDELVARLRDRPRFCLDTEFISERTYRPRLCLLQIGVDEEAVAIDPFAVTSLDGILALIVDGTREKVLHAGRQDMMIVYDLTGELPRNILDTQVAAALTGYGDSVGHNKLVEAVLGVRLARAESYTDWSRRPLSTAQLEYALDDVRHLLAVRERLGRELKELGREAWLDEELRVYEDAAYYVRDPQAMFTRVKGAGRLAGVEVAALQLLAAWREEEASHRDLPRGRVIGDDVLIGLARRRPRSLRGLDEMRGLNPRFIERYGDRVLGLLEDAERMPRERWPELDAGPAKDPTLATHVDLLEVVLKRRATEQRIGPGYLATRSQLHELVHRVASGTEGVTEGLPVLEGWRREAVGKDLLALLRGELALALDPQEGAVRLFDVPRITPPGDGRSGGSPPPR
jgi:ribonuclease D